MYRTGSAKILFVLGNVLLVVTVLGSIAFGAAVEEHEKNIKHDVATRIAAEHRNHFWLMLAGREPAEATSAGLLATRLKPFQTARNPVNQLAKFKVKSGEFPGINDYMGMTVAQPNGGKLTPEFVVKAAQATPETVSDVLEPLPAVGTPGLLSWFNLILAASVTFVSGLLSLFGSRVARRRSDRREAVRRHRERELQREREEAALTPAERELSQIEQRVQSVMPSSPERRKVLEEVKATRRRLEQMRKQDTQADAQQEFKRFMGELKEIVTAAEAGSEVYRRLSSPDDPSAK